MWYEKDIEDEKHFKWVPNTGQDEEPFDLYIFQDDAKFVRAGSPKARVFLLKFLSNTEKHFFWMQDPNTQ